MKKLLTLACLLGLGLTSSAHAMTLSAVGGYSSFSGAAYGSQGNLLLGGELTFGIGPVGIGAFLDHNSFKNNGGSLNFYGVVGRVSSPIIHIFADAKVGLDSISGSSNSALGLGAGVGYQIGLAPMLSLSPRIGYRYLPLSFGSGTVTGSAFDFGAMLSLGF